MAVRSLTIALALLALAPAVTAHSESAAPLLRPDVVRVWHDPAQVVSGEAWHGYLQLAPDSNVSAAYFQVCRVGQACFNPPTPAHRLENGTYTFSSADIGEGVDLASGWHVGVRWWLDERNGTRLTSARFPVETPCDETSLECSESHYFSFDVAEAPKHAFLPGVGLLPLATALAAVALAARARRRDA